MYPTDRDGATCDVNRLDHRRRRKQLVAPLGVRVLDHLIARAEAGGGTAAVGRRTSAVMPTWPAVAFAGGDTVKRVVIASSSRVKATGADAGEIVQPCGRLQPDTGL